MLAFVAPITREGFTGVPDATRFDDPLISVRYCVAPKGSSGRWVRETYVIGVGRIEVPLRNKDHASRHGPFGEIAAGLFSLEKRPIAGIAYVVYHHTREYRNGRRQSVNVCN